MFITTIALLTFFFIAILVLLLSSGHYQAKKKESKPKFKLTMKDIYLSPLLFTLKILNLKLFPYQAEMVECPDKRIVFVCGRQVGKTYVIAILALWRAFTRPDQTILIVAPTLRQSKIPYERVRALIDGIPFLKKYRIKDTLSETGFKNGSTIHCLPSGRLGQFVTGFPADLVIYDEAAFIPDPVFDALKPSIAAKRGDVLMSGTPFGMEGKFYEAVEGDISTQKKFRWKIFKIPSIKSPLIDADFLEDEREHLTEAEFKMWYEGEFIAETDEFFPKVALKRLLRDYDKDKKHYPLNELKYLDKEFMEQQDIPLKKGDRIIGLDIARMGTDETAGVVLERLRDNTIETVKRGTKLYKVIWRGTLAKTSAPEAGNFGWDMMKFFDAKLLVVDASGVGGGAFDLLLKDFGEKVEAVTFSVPTRRAMYNILKIAIERENLILNADDKKFLKQFGSFKLKKTDSATGEMHIKKTTTAHDDLPDALALALWGYEAGGRWGVLDPTLTEPVDPDAPAEGKFQSDLNKEMIEMKRIRDLEAQIEKEMAEKGATKGEVEDEKEKKKRLLKESEFWGI